MVSKMDVLNAKLELAHILDTHYDQLMWDLYSGLCDSGPAYFDELFLHTSKNQAILEIKNNSFRWGGEEDEVFRAVMSEDHGTIIDVLGRTNKAESTLDNLLHYLHHNRLSFRNRFSEYERKKDNGLNNPPVGKVW